MDVARFVGRRLVQLVVVLFLVTFFTFTLIRLLPGDPTTVLLQGIATPQQKAALEADLGLDKPFLEQYGDYMGHLAQGDFGHVYSTNQEVGDLIKESLPVSIELMLYAQVLALLIAIPLGVFTAYRAGTRSDKVVSTGAFALLAIPNFVLGFFLAYFVGTELHWLPSQGYEGGWLDWIVNGASADIWGHIEHMVLPTIALAAGQVAVYMRLLRSDMVATLQEDFITMAKSKGISDRRVLWRHALRPSSLTLLTVAGLYFGTLIGGAIVVEVIFQLPGIGTMIYQSVIQREYVELQGCVVVIALMFVLVNFVVDFLYVVLDPRIRRARVRV
jgi:peptide/nickel transport system permease protein